MSNNYWTDFWVKYGSNLEGLDEQSQVLRTKYKKPISEELWKYTLDRIDENVHATMIGFYHPAEDRCFLLTLKDGAMEEACAGKHPQALQELDVVVLSDLLLECIQFVR